MGVFNVFKKLSLKWRIITQLFLGISLVYFLILFFIASESYTNAKNAAQKLSISDSFRFSNSIRSILSIDMGVARTTATWLSNVHKYGDNSEQLLKQQVSKVVMSQHRYCGAQYIFKNDFFKRENFEENTHLIRSFDKNGKKLNVSEVDIYHAVDSLYLNAIKKNKTYLLEPQMGKDSMGYYSTILTPIISYPDRVGVVKLSISLLELSKMLKSTLNNNDIGMLLSSKGVVVAHNDSSLVGKHFFELFPELKDNLSVVKQLSENRAFNFVYETDGEEYYFSFTNFRVGNSDNQWLGGTAIKLSLFSKASSMLIQKSIAFGIIGIVFIMIIVWLIAVSITRPVEAVTMYVNKVGSGDISNFLDYKYTNKDEIGQMILSLNNMTRDLNKFVNSIRDESDQLTAQAQDLELQSQDLSSSSAQMASNSEEVSSVIEEISTNIMHNKINAERTEIQSNKVSVQISTSHLSSREVKQTMHNAASKIGVINEIARQTNILALNAAVEAASAGVAGRGFGVVAAEVKKLAEKSKSASDIIHKMIQDAVVNSDKAGEQLNEVVPEIEETIRMVKEILVASAEQTIGIDQIVKALSELNTLTQKNASLADMLRDRSNILSVGSKKLDGLVEVFITMKN